MCNERTAVNSFVLQVASLNDKSDYRAVEQAIKTVGFGDYADTIWRTLAAILHLVSNWNCAVADGDNGFSAIILKFESDSYVCHPPPDFYLK
jgi:myosin heavy subunit